MIEAAFVQTDKDTAVDLQVVPLIIGLGILELGVPPGGEEVARALWFLLTTICYARSG